MDPLTAIALVALALVVGCYGTVIGAGGGFLLIPGLALLFGVDGAQAVGTGAMTLALIRLTGAVSYDRQGLVERGVAVRVALVAAPVALLSGWFLTNRFDSDTLLTIVGLLLLSLAVFVVVRPSPPDVDRIGVMSRLPAGSAAIGPSRSGPLALVAAAVGFLAGTFAVGGGLILVPMLVRVERLPAHRAAATTTAAGLVMSAAATVGHTIAGNVAWSLVPSLLAGAVTGSAAGARLAGRLPARSVMLLLAAGLVTAGAPLIGFAQFLG